MVTILMMSAKVTTLSLLKLKVITNKYYVVIISVYDAIKKKLSRESNFIVDLVMRPKYGNFRASMRKVIIASLL